MKKLLILAIACLSTAASAAGAAPDYADAEGGIVTPEKARGFFVAKMYKLDANGDVMVCPPTAVSSLGRCMMRHGEDIPLVPMVKAVPAGRTFVGFRVVSAYQGERQIEVYYR